MLFPGQRGKAGETIRILMQQEKTEMVVVVTRTPGHPRLQSNHHHKHNNTQFLQLDTIPVTQLTVVKALKHKTFKYKFGLVERGLQTVQGC